jgi:DNA-binding GntR family transcriptional regulator
MTSDQHIKSSVQIASRITEAILAKQLAPGARLGEQPLADLFGVSRTQIREALTRLVTRGIVTVSARRGWFVIKPSQTEAREAFEARRVIELGLLRQARPVGADAIRALQDHVQREQAAIKCDDIGARSFLLGDFHVCLCECLGNQLLADTLRDLTARTTLTAMLHQSTHQAETSCDEHVHIVAALARGDLAHAEQLMHDHLLHVESDLYDIAPTDPLNALRLALSPVAAAQDTPRKSAARNIASPSASSHASTLPLKPGKHQ